MLSLLIRSAKHSIDRQYYMALVATSMPAVLFYQQGAWSQRSAIAYEALLFVATSTAYQWHHAFYHQATKPASLRSFLQAAPQVRRLLLMALLSLALPWSILILFVLLALFALAYSYPLLEVWGIASLNRYGLLKPFLLSAVWVLATALLPMYMMGTLQPLLLWQYSLMVCLSCCLFDARDAAKDARHQVRTLANRMRSSTFHALMYGVVLGYWALAYQQHALDGVVITRGITALLCIRYYALCSAYVFEVAINGLLLFFALTQLFV